MSATTMHIVPMGPGRFGVQVTEGDTTTSHEVTVPADVLEDAGIAVLGDGEDDVAERVVRETFAFLLEREPASAILREFGLADIERYFPGYRTVIRDRLAR